MSVRLMLEARTVSIGIDRPWRDVYEMIWRPEAFPRWASGLAKSALSRDGERWKAEGAEGTVWIRFTDLNPFGVMDHSVDVGSGRDVHVPMRVVANEDGSEVMLTVFQQPEMSDEKFRSDIEWVQRDLLALRALVMG